MLQIFAIIDDTSVMNFRKKLQHNFPKMRGGGQRPFGTFPKIHPFWKGSASLSWKTMKMENIIMGRVWFLHEPGIVLQEVWKALTKPGKQHIVSFSSEFVLSEF